MIKKKSPLGKGGFGEVWLAIMNKHTDIAMKNLLDKLENKQKEKVMHEVEIMEKVRHPKLINFYGFWKDEGNKTSWIIDLLPGGDLDKLLHNRKLKKVSMVERFIILKNIAIGIQGFHAKNIVHRDIKPGNVLFPEEISENKIILNAKLADYGESVDLKSEKMNFIKINIDTIDEFDCMDTYCGTLKYAPKEILMGDLRLLSTKSDIYSFGVLMWEVFTEKRPLDNVKDAVIQEYASNENKDSDILKPYHRMSETGNDKGEIVKENIPFLKNTPKEIEFLIEKCLHKEINKRPSIDEILEELIEIEEKYGLTYFQE